MKDVPSMPRREEYAKGIGRRGSRVEKLEIEAKDL